MYETPCGSLARETNNARRTRNLMLYLPRLAVLVTIVADRPGAWFPGPLSPYLTRFSGICLSQDFKRAKVPGNPMKSPFCFGVFWGHIF